MAPVQSKALKGNLNAFQEPCQSRSDRLRATFSCMRQVTVRVVGFFSSQISKASREARRKAGA